MHRDHAKYLAALAVAVLLQACSQNIGPFKAQHKATSALADREKVLVDAQANLVLVNAQNNVDVVNARALARAHDPRNASTAATNNADARISRAEAKQKIADAQFAVDKAKAEASDKVAIAGCQARTGAGANSCKGDATASFDSEVVTAKTQNVPPI